MTDAAINCQAALVGCLDDLFGAQVAFAAIRRRRFSQGQSVKASEPCLAEAA